jgi:aldehyde:ferredoxin oxidoreductase
MWQDVFAIIDSAGLCIFFCVRNLLRPVLEFQPDGILDYLNAITGAEYTLDELTKAGERILNAERTFLLRAGFSRRDDTLPTRLTHEPLPEGPAKGLICHLEEMLDEYYLERGWSRDGIPTEAKLKELGLT